MTVRGRIGRCRWVFGTAVNPSMEALAFIALSFVITASTLAAGPTPLDRYLQGLRSLRAEFSQTLVDSRDQVVDQSNGTLVVLRPGKFRWEVMPRGAKKESSQLLIADGRNVWFFDRELEQVTVKPEDAALSSTPAMLLSATGDFRKNFTIESAGERQGFEWVLVEPRAVEADFRRALLGFKKDQLVRMIIDDKLGQTATVDFESSVRNASVAPEEVRFEPPPGVDVIGIPAR
jgi:outer membrane lipoprotein carrier protein